MLQEITAQYVTAYDRGERPSIEDYMRRYPAYASDLLDFAVFYHGYVADLPISSAQREPQLDEYASAAMAKIRGLEAQTPVPAIAEPAAVPYGSPGRPVPQIKGIVAEGISRRIAPAKLAAMVRVTPDVLAKLDARAIAVASIPSAFLRELARVLEVPVGSIQAYLSGTASTQARFYFSETAPTQGQESFLQAIDESALPFEQKLAWREDVEREGLA